MKTKKFTKVRLLKKSHLIARASQVTYLIAGLFCLLLLCAAGAGAQNTADIVGTVTDTSGAVLPGATVTLTNTGTNISQMATSSGSGDFTFTLVQVGSYSVKVEAKGFKTSVTPISVSAGDRARVDAKMEVGDVTQTVEVSANVAPALQTDTSTIGTLVTSQAVEDVPLNGRNITKLLALSAGATEGQGNAGFSLIGGQRPDDRRQSTALSINGQDEALNNNLVDGIDNNERIIGGNVVRPSVDAIQEVNVSTNLYDATVGRTGGGVVEVITKSGSNKFHGSVYEFFRNRVLNTNPGYAFPSACPAAPTVCTPANVGRTPVLAKPAFRQNQYGASLGGPIKKDKTFFFGDFEQLKYAIGTPITISVPTLCERGLTLAKLQGYSGTSVTCPNGNPTTPGDFQDISAITALNGGGTGSGGPGVDLSNISNPGALTSPFFGLNKQGLEFFSMYPLPNASGTLNNYTSSPLRTQQSTTLDGRIDHHFSESDTIFGRYTVNDVTTLTPAGFPTVNIDPTTGTVAASGAKGIAIQPGGGGPGFAGIAKERQQMFSGSYVHIFRPNLLMNLKVAYLRSAIGSFGANNGSNVSNLLGFPCSAVACVNPAGQTTATGLEQITLAVASPANGAIPSTPSYTGFGDSSFLPLLEYDNTFQYSGAITWTKGSHSIKMGVTLIRRRATIGQSQSPNGVVPFNGIYTGVPAADLLQGLSPGGTLRSFGLVAPSYRMWEPSTYLQDDWRARHWLTLNLGIRYDIFTPFTEKRGRISNYNPATGLLISPSVPGAQQSGPTAGIKTDYLDIAPRFGFDATLKHDFVIRGGFGLTFFPINYQSGYNLKNAPFLFSYICAVQQTNNSQSQCQGAFANGATAHYGPLASNPSSSVGQTGGFAFSAGSPLPVLNVANMFAPSAAQCSLDPSGTVKNYATTCPKFAGSSFNDPYQVFNATSVVPFNFPAAYLEQMNIQVQKAFGQNVITVGEVTELGRRLQKGLPQNALSNYTQVIGGFNAPPLAAAFPWLALTTVTENANTATSAYNALQATFVRRFSKGLTTQFNYTWSHNLTNFVSAGGNAASCTPTLGSTLSNPTISTDNPCFYDVPGSSPFVQTWYNKGSYAWGNSTYDVADRVGWTLNYQSPFGKSLAGLEGAIVKGWGFNVAGSWQTGSPFQVTQGGSAGLTGIGSNGLPDQICAGRLAHPTLLQWFNPACFESQSVGGTFGNEHVNQLFGPAQRHLDFSIFKEFPVREQIRLQFRTEVFNLFNTPNFSTPNASVQYVGCNPAAANGAVATTRCIGTPITSSNSSFPTGSISSLQGASNSRQIQFALKLVF